MRQRLADARGVGPGMVLMADVEDVLASGPLGSCVAVVAHTARRGALAHVMLPGTAPAGAEHPLRYATDAVAELVRLLTPETPLVLLAGGANVLQREGETIHVLVADAVCAAVQQQGWPVAAMALGGRQRRSVWFNAADGRCYLATGDAAPVLWPTD